MKPFASNTTCSAASHDAATPHDASRVSGGGITETLVMGLELLTRRRAYVQALALKGKLDLRIDLDLARERVGR